MSFDVFFQGFLAGEWSEHGGARIREVLGDGEADIYLHDSGMMANHISGRDPWALLWGRLGGR